MIGPLRPMCESNIDSLSESGFLKKSAVREQWAAFLRRPDERSWTGIRTSGTGWISEAVGSVSLIEIFVDC